MKKILILFTFIPFTFLLGQTVIWESDFSNPSEWIIDHDANDCSLDFQIGNISCAGSYPITDINSTTASNGWAILDSDNYSQATPAEDSWLTMSTPLDLNVNSNVYVEFETFYRRYQCEVPYLVVGIGDGNGNVNWPNLDVNSTDTNPNVFYVFPEFANGGCGSPQGAMTENPETVTIDIRPALVGLTPAQLSDIYIRFNWTGSYGFAWFIDDFKVKTLADNDIRLMSSSSIRPSNDDCVYGRIPKRQIPSTLNASWDVNNFGANTQTDVSVTFNVNADSFNIPVGNVFSWDTLNVNEDINTSLDIGLHEIVGIVESNEEDINSINYNNNSKTSYLEVTPNIYARDAIDVDPNIRDTTYLLNINTDHQFNIKYRIQDTSLITGLQILLDTTSYNFFDFADCSFQINEWENNVGGCSFTPATSLNGTDVFGFGQWSPNGSYNSTYQDGLLNVYFEQPILLDTGVYVISIIYPILEADGGNSVVKVRGQYIEDYNVFSPQSMILFNNCDNGVWDILPAVRIIMGGCQNLIDSSSFTISNICTGNNSGAIFSNIGGGSGNYDYQWFNGSGLNIGSGVSIQDLPNGIYELYVEDIVDGCYLSKQFTIEELSPVINAYPQNAMCAELSDGSIYFSIDYENGLSYPPYLIELNNGDEDTLTSSSGPLFDLFQGTYNYQITDGNGCTYLGGNPIEIGANDMNFGIDIQPNPSAGQSPLFVIFDNNTPNASNYNFTWYFGDGTSELNNAGFVSHTYAVDGLWDVVVVAEEISSGCTDTLFLEDFIFSTGGVSCTHSATINQSGPITGCSGSILLTCNTDPTFTYQWNINGVPINGATDSEYAPVTNGNYSVTIYQDNCPVNSGSVNVSITNVVAPLISASGTITSCAGGSITLDAGSGYSDYLWSTGGTGQTEVVTSSGDYTVTVTDATTGCSVTSAPYTVNASFMQPQQVCIVGIDSLSNFNRVVWEKPISDGIDYFNVYKEGSAANVYDLIGSVPYDDTAVFVDVNSNTSVQAYRYKVSIVDTCGTESALGEFHKTIHLTINQGVGQTWNLIWNHYEGFGFPSYNIYRGTDPSNISLLTTIASNLNSYTDLNPPGGTSIYYQIEVVNTNGCDPLKATDYGVSRSNIATVEVGNILELTTEEISISPNPTTNLITIQSESVMNNKFKIYDQQGREVMNGKLNGKNTEVSLGKLSRGTYTIQVDGNYKPAVIIKQ